MDHNEDNDPIDDDDDQHVHTSQPPLDCLFYFGSAKLITSSQHKCMGDGKPTSP
jgi:hypothetical protein